MEILREFKTEYAVLIVRVIAGILFAAQGYDKLFRLGLRKTNQVAVEELYPIHFPVWLVKLITSVTALLEFSCGVLLVLGIFILPSCYILTACLLPITMAMSLREPMWNMQLVWTRLVMLIFLLLMPLSVHKLSLDYLFGFYAN